MNKQTFVQIKKRDGVKQIVMGEVYVPLVPDSQGDYMTSDEIEKAAHGFMKNRRMYKVDTEHDLNDNGSVVIESFIARPGDPDFEEGAWVVGMWVPAEIYKQVEEGEINGFSMYGSGVRHDRVVEIEIPDDGVIRGETQINDGHAHTFYIKFNEEGELVDGWTDEVDGHKHKIETGTITEEADKHTHRYSITDALAILMKGEDDCDGLINSKTKPKKRRSMPGQDERVADLNERFV